MLSLFDLFKIGIGPSSSHTVGPMRAAQRFTDVLADLPDGPLEKDPARIVVTLYGSLALTAEGHGTIKAILLGLAGETPEHVNPDTAQKLVQHIESTHLLNLNGTSFSFDYQKDICLDTSTIPPIHPNTMQFEAFSRDGSLITRQRFCSVGGGFITPEEQARTMSYSLPDVPYPFRSGAALLAHTKEHHTDIASIVLKNETAIRPLWDVERGMDRIADVMFACIEAGLHHTDTLPGPLKVQRRAAKLYARLQAKTNAAPSPHNVMNWISLFAIAVNEENAAGGRVVTAPTNGAAGVIPAVMRYYRDFCPEYSKAGLRTFLLTAAAIGGLFKLNASISGAEVGCQGEVGVASSMAAAGLTAALGGSPEQCEHAAEIAMEHHLGMTCDPVAGLVQIPCIERNAFGAVKAINASSLAMSDDANAHYVSLDHVIKTMAETGRDMNHRYKETALGGLAVNVPAC